MNITVSAWMNPLTGYQSAASVQLGDAELGARSRFTAVVRMKDRWFEGEKANNALLARLIVELRTLVKKRPPGVLPANVTWTVSYQKGSWLLLFKGIGGVAQFLKDYPEIRKGAIDLFNDICYLAKKGFHAAYWAVRKVKDAYGTLRRAGQVTSRSKRKPKTASAPARVARKIELPKALAPPPPVAPPTIEKKRTTTANDPPPGRPR